jgi:hypothetical protein
VELAGRGLENRYSTGCICITHVVWTISLYISNDTVYVVQEPYKLDFIDDMADTIVQEHTDPCRRDTRSAFLKRALTLAFLLLRI